MTTQTTNKSEVGTNKTTVNTALGFNLLEILERINEPLKMNQGHIKDVDSLHSDKASIFLVDSLIRAVHFPLYGTGSAYGNMKDQMDRSQNNLLGLYEKYQGDQEGITNDANFEKFAFFANLNETRYFEYVEIFNALTEVYEYITGEAWVFTERVPGAKSNMSDEEKAGVLAQMKRMSEQETADENAGPAPVYRDGERVA
jgi:hypothetical protein